MKAGKNKVEYISEKIKEIEQLSYNVVRSDDPVELQATVYKINQLSHDLVRLLDTYGVE
mgnify:FL=1